MNTKGLPTQGLPRPRAVGRADRRGDTGSIETRNPFRRRELRRDADRLIRAGARVHPASALLRWRAAELTSARERAVFARTLRRTVTELDGKHLPSAVPLNRRGIRPYATDLAGLADYLSDSSRPVNARGMLLVRDLVSGGGSPLYDRGRADDLPDVVRGILAAMNEGR